MSHIETPLHLMKVKKGNNFFKTGDIQASTLTFFLTCPFGQLTKKVLVRLNFLVVQI
jgi:hypothetical protein